MIEILHAFAIGIAFSVGVTVGAVLSSIASRQGRKEMVEDWKSHQTRVEDRLAKYVVESGRMAAALELIAKEKTKLG